MLNYKMIIFVKDKRVLDERIPIPPHREILINLLIKSSDRQSSKLSSTRFLQDNNYKLSIKNKFRYQNKRTP